MSKITPTEQLTDLTGEAKEEKNNIDNDNDEWIITITSQIINLPIGSIVTQGSSKGTLKTALDGATTSLIVLSPTSNNFTFLTTTDIVLETNETETETKTAKITIVAINIDTAIHNINITTNDDDPATSSSYELPQPWSPKLYTDRGLESKGWMEFAGGFIHNYQDDSFLCFVSSIMPCAVAALNASELQENLEHEPKWMLRMAALYMLNPCSTGSAIREDIWKLATSTREQRPGSFTHKKSFCFKARFFCLPHCCCFGGCCCAVAQDRRALINARKAVNDVKIFKPTFRAADLSGSGGTGNSKTE